MTDRNYKRTASIATVDIQNAEEAGYIIGSDGSFMIARPGHQCCRFPFFCFIIPEGFYALVTRHGAHEPYTTYKGKISPLWPSGIHWGPPWLKVSHLVTKQTMFLHTKIEDIQTKDNVNIQIELSLALRVMGEDPDIRPGDNPANVYNFVHEVTAAGLQSQISAAQKQVLGNLVGTLHHTEVFRLNSHYKVDRINEIMLSSKATDRGDALDNYITNHQKRTDNKVEQKWDMTICNQFNAEIESSFKESIKDSLNKQFNVQGIEITDIIVRDIKIPELMQAQMRDIAIELSQSAIENMQREQAMLSLLQEHEIETLTQTHQRQERELMQQGNYEYSIEKLKLEQLRSEGDRQITSINSQMSVDVELVRVESNLTLQRIKDEATLETEQIRQQSIADSKIELANVKAEVDIMLAKADLEVSKNIAKGNKVVFEAEGMVAPMNCRLNDFTTGMLKRQAQLALAKNEKLIITGKEGGKAANILLQADTSLKNSSTADNNQQSRKAILEEIALATGIS